MRSPQFSIAASPELQKVNPSRTMNEKPLISNPVQPRNCGLAIWSLLLGILAVVLSVVCIGPLLAIPAVICGHLAYSRIKRSAGALSGQGLALGGLITGYVSIAMIPIIAMMAAIAIPNFVKARDMAQRNACINNLRQIEGAKQSWALGQKKSDGDPVTMPDISNFLPANPLNCPKGGLYQINPVGEAPTCSIPGHELGAGNSVAPPPRGGTSL
jgi:hypothetical protein